MATREENLNQINTELEKLTDEELENIAGGTQSETDLDRQALALRHKVSSVNATKDEIRAAFASYGIIAEVHGGHGTPNSYIIPGGIKLNHQQVWAYIIAKHG